MSKGTSFPSKEELKSFFQTCKQAFPKLKWQLSATTEAVNCYVEARIPGTSLDVFVEFWFDSNSAVATVSDNHRVQIFCSTKIQGQSLDEVLTHLKNFLTEYARSILNSIAPS